MEATISTIILVLVGLYLLNRALSTKTAKALGKAVSSECEEVVIKMEDNRKLASAAHNVEIVTEFNNLVAEMNVGIATGEEAKTIPTRKDVDTLLQGF